MKQRVFPVEVVCLYFVLAVASAANWPEWRGPGHSGMATGDAPLKWSDSQNIKWRASVPGRGHSSPIVWGDKVFLTTAISSTPGVEEEPLGIGGPPVAAAGCAAPFEASLIYRVLLPRSE